MKKLVVMFVGCLLTLSLLFTACSASVTPSVPSQEPAEQVAEKETAPPQSEETALPQNEDREWNVALCTIYPFDQAVWLSEMIEEMRQFDEQNDQVTIRFVEVSETSQYEPKIRALAEQGIYDMIMTQFSGHVEATIAVAKDYPDIVFFNQDGMIEGIENYPNITEGRGGDRLSTGFLTGVLAALMTKTG